MLSPLAKSILFKAVAYRLPVFMARLIEAFIHYVVAGSGVGRDGFIGEQLSSFSWHGSSPLRCGFRAFFWSTLPRARSINSSEMAS
jgi:hypothetical protein